MATTITRFTWDNDSGTPDNPVGDGATVDNGELQKIFDAIDMLFANGLTFGGNLTLEGGNLAVVGTVNATGQATFSGPGPSIVSAANIRAGTNASGDALVILGRASDNLANILFLTNNSSAQTGAIQVNPALGQMALRVGSTPTTVLTLTTAAITPAVPVHQLQVGDAGPAAAGKIGFSGNALVFLGGSAGHAFLNSGGGPTTTVDASGNWSMTGRINRAAAQPGFLAQGTGQSINAGAAVTATFNEIYDETSNFSGNTFTALVTGRYLLTAILGGTTSAAGMSIQAQVVTSNRSYPFAAGSLANDFSLPWMAIVDMDAADTARVDVTSVGGPGGSFLTLSRSSFSGRLMP